VLPRPELVGDPTIVGVDVVLDIGRDWQRVVDPGEAAPADPAATTTTTTARTSTANDWTPDHAVMSGTKEQLKAMPQFKYSDYN
jgi:hypothetical protein